MSRHWAIIDGIEREMCVKHSGELDAWLAPSPETYRSMGGRGGINIVQIGKMTAVRLHAEQEAFVARADKALAEQCTMIRRFCWNGRNCSSRAEDMWSANGDGIKPAPETSQS